MSVSSLRSVLGGGGAVLLRSTFERATACARAPVLTEPVPALAPLEADESDGLLALFEEDVAFFFSVRVLAGLGLVSSDMHRFRGLEKLLFVSLRRRSNQNKGLNNDQRSDGN